LKLSVVLLKLGFRPVRVRLKNLSQTGTLWEDISQAIQRVDESDPEPAGAAVPDVMLKGKVLDEPLPFRGTSISSHILIFDGWDEISRSASKTYKSG
jgi:hypothetical protein